MMTSGSAPSLPAARNRGGVLAVGLYCSYGCVGSVKVTWRVRSSVPRTAFSSRVPPRAAASASNRSSGVLVGWPAAATIRSPGARPAQSPGHVTRGDGDAQPWRCRGLAAGERIGAASQGLVGGDGKVEAFTEAVCVDPEQLPVGVQDRATGGAGQQWGGVLEAAGDAPAAGTAEGPLDAGDEPERHTQPAPARVGQGEHRLADLH